MLYFGPRDGFMASEAQLRTVLTLCDPRELAAVRRVAVNNALFWAYGSGGGGLGGGAVGGGAMVGGLGPFDMYHDHHATIASSLLVDVLRLVRARLPGLRELVVVPRDENPLYSGACCLVEPAMAQSRLVRQVREAMGIVFDDDAPLPGGSGGGGDVVVPWAWKVMTLSADPDPPVYGRGVLGWEDEEDEEDDEEEAAGAHGASGGGVVLVEEEEDGSGHGRGADGGAGMGERQARARKHRMDREATRLGTLQESVRRRFMQMDMGVCR